MTEIVVTVDVLAPQGRFTLIGEWSYAQCGQRIDAGDGSAAPVAARAPALRYRSARCAG